MSHQRIVVPYAGDPDGLTAIAILAKGRDVDVVALVFDLGQGQELEDLRDRALAAGAVRAHVLDIREEFARDCLIPALHRLPAGQPSLFSVDLAAPLVASKLAEIAAIEGAAASADGFRAPLNLWVRTGPYVWTKPAADAPVTGADVDLAFEKGVPAAINGVPMAPVELIEILNIIAGHHGVGRIDMNETASEAPAAVVLGTAYGALKREVPNARPDQVNGSVRIALHAGQYLVTGCDVRPAVTAS